MVPKPKQNKAQTQPITTTLSNILRDYPAGGTVLRELLQNADDAGASKIDFHLSTSSATTDVASHPLLHPDLIEYQGSAILAYNSHPPFLDNDFESLSRVGDSLKRFDVTKTGKFGLGFNSVYNWTDSPSVLTGSSLLLLDPHHSWSADIGKPGGPVYDFVHYAGQPEMTNQLAPFSELLVGHDFREPLDGTVIRLPLRTKEQAMKSRICKTSVGVEDMREVMKGFAEGFSDGYGVFLRNVGEIGFWEDGRKIGGYRVVNEEEVKEARTKINEAYSDIFVDETKDSFALAFEAEVEVTLPCGGVSRKIWAVRHTMQKDVGPKLTEWGKERKLFGWVGVAVPIQEVTEAFVGGLFTVLPLYKPSGHLAHLHGLFSITSDRASIHSHAEKRMQDQNPFLWNEKLFNSLIPTSWAGLLDHLQSSRLKAEDLMDYWPKPGSMVGDLGEGLYRKLFDLVQSSSIPVFFTDQGFVTLDEGLFVKAEEVEEGLRFALKEVGVPVVYVQQRHLWLHDRVLARVPTRILSSKTLCTFLRSNDQLENASAESKNVLLEFILSAVVVGGSYAGIKMLYGLPLFRLEDQTYFALRKRLQPVFMNIGETEERLFRLQPEHNLDLRSLSATAVGILSQVARTENTPIRRHSVDSLIEYCQRKLFPPSSGRGGIIPFSPILRELIDDIWSWVAVNAGDSDLQSLTSSLWLIPLHGGYLRRCDTTSPSVPTLHQLSGAIGQLLERLADLSDQSVVLPLLDPEPLSPQSLRFLVNRSARDWLMLGSCKNLMNLLSWLVVGKGAVLAATDGDKRLLLKFIARRFVLKGGSITVGELLKQLPLFEHVESHFTDGVMEQKRKWIDSQGEMLVGIGNLPFSPKVSNTAFVQIDDQNVRDMLSALGIASWPTTGVLLEDYLLPSLTPEKCSILPDGIKTQTLELLLCNHLSPKCRYLVSELPIVPVEIEQAGATSPAEKQIFCPMSKLVDQRASDIRELFFPDELLYPRKSLFSQFDGVMQQYGLRSKLTWGLALDRIRMYAASERPLADIETCVRTLLQLPAIGSAERSASEYQEVMDLEWVVARDIQTQQLARMKPSACRATQYRTVIGRVLSVLDYEVHSEWEGLLEWRDVHFRASELEKQLKIGIAETDMTIVNGVFAYMSQRGFPDEYMDAIRPISCVLGASGNFFAYSEVFYAGANGLQPYLDVVDNGFLKQHKALLKKLDVARRPELDDIFYVQEQLAAIGQPLDEGLTAVAVEVVKLASRHDRSKLISLKIPDQTGSLQDIENIAFWDMEFSSKGQDTPLVNQKIPESVVLRLGIEPFSDKILMNKLGIHDQEDEDEFFQHEDTITRIADTLGRYSVTSTFSEYLANAEDSPATCVDWLLDECIEGSYPAQKLISKDLHDFQGQALFVHNDGVFQDEDFDGFKRVGRGSKREEEWAIGQFGRGAQTMYHWTDVPMLISGKYFLILDPQQKLLPLNRKHGRRKPGLKLELSKLRETCPDQLLPFDGLWAYKKDLDEYEGTIFRFPLRPQGSKTRLTEPTRYLGVDTARSLLEKYFPTARMSLLFLQNVTRITFRLRHAENLQFEVNRSQPLLDYPIEAVKIQHHHTDAEGQKIQGVDDWRIARQDISTIPDEIREWQERASRRQKYPKCGIAAPFPPSTSRDFKAMIFSTLPLPFEPRLPVHINASFALSGDRRSILVEEASLYEGSAWNKWLLQESIPSLYLRFLEDLVRTSGADVFKFWPAAELGDESLSNLVRLAFWEKIPSSRHRLYPEAKNMAPSPVLRTGRSGGSRQAHVPIVSWDVKEAMFDFLCESSPASLQDLVRGWFPNLVRVSERKISKNLKTLGLKALAPICVVTPATIRQKLQTAPACDELEKCSEKVRVLNELLPIVWPKSKEEQKELDGCRILPLRNGSLGSLQLARSNGETYFYTTRQEQQLFAFASNKFVGGEVWGDPFGTQSTKFVKWLVDSSAFNVRNLAPQDLKEILPCRNSTDWEPTPALGTWLRGFWSYFNNLPSPPSEIPLLSSKPPSLAQCGIDHFPIFRAAKMDSICYITPKEYESLPAVPKPSSQRELELCRKFPELYLVDQDFMPSSLAAEPLFPRFLKSIGIIAASRGVGLDEFLAPILDKNCIIILRDLAQKSTYFRSFGTPSAGREELGRAIRLLPIWLSVVPGSYIAAANALATIHTALLVPWLSQRTLFIDPTFLVAYSSRLTQLGVQMLKPAAMFATHILPSMPSELSPDQINHYQAVLGVVPKDVLLRYKDSKLAIDGFGLRRRANELYDHEDSVYSAAFGLHNGSRFLHPALRMRRSIWVEMGLLGEGTSNIDASLYLASVKSLEQRILTLQTSEAIQISSKVLQGLSRLGPTADLGTLYGIRDAKVVYPGNPDTGAPAFRQNNMFKFKETKPILKLSEVIHQEHAPYCWTQAHFSRIQLSKSGFRTLGLSGAPPISMVWNHLRALVKVAATLNDSDAEPYLKDLSKTYGYLQDNPSGDFEPHRSAEKIWLNLNEETSEPITASKINDAWIDVTHLLLFCPYDPGNMQAVRPYLTPYQELLKRCGCQPIHTPIWKEVDRPAHNTMPSQVSRLWKDSKLTDVTFKTERGLVSAHKLVLAAASKKYETRFTGGWGDSLDASNNTPIELRDINHETLLRMLDFAYHDHLDFRELQPRTEDNNDQLRKKLDDLLDLLSGADEWLMEALHAKVESQILSGAVLYIRPDNVDFVLDIAKQANAKEIEKYCVEYTTLNFETVMVARRD
ncbi:MAG: hypothetical protein M1839_002251 [Geoglossum umbratile]|nr:MAG: hypothetical protein M1839_002251 [Geoglossum umbratile]